MVTQEYEQRKHRNQLRRRALEFASASPGVASGNIAIGILIGVIFGLAIGAGIDRQGKNKDK
jgi:hypothetical protein